MTLGIDVSKVDSFHTIINSFSVLVLGYIGYLSSVISGSISVTPGSFFEFAFGTSSVIKLFSLVQSVAVFTGPRLRVCVQVMME